MLTLTKDDQVEKEMLAEIGLFHRLEKAELIAEDLSAKLEKAEADKREMHEAAQRVFHSDIISFAQAVARAERAEAELAGLKKIIAAANSTASMAHYGGYIKGYIK